MGESAPVGFANLVGQVAMHEDKVFVLRTAVDSESLGSVRYRRALGP